MKIFAIMFLVFCIFIKESQAEETEASRLMQKVWSSYTPTQAEKTEVSWLNITTPYGEIHKGGLMVNHGKSAIFVVDRGRINPLHSEGLLLQKNFDAPLSCGVLFQTERSDKQIKRSPNDYGNNAGKTTANYFDICRLLLGDNTNDYEYRMSGIKIIAKSKVKNNGDCDEAALIIEDIQKSPKVGEYQCLIGQSKRTMSMEDFTSVDIDGKKYWRPNKITIIDGRNLVTTIVVTKRSLVRNVKIDKEFLLDNSKGGWEW